jgi:tRNA(Ile)-lysidine synthase
MFEAFEQNLKDLVGGLKPGTSGREIHFLLTVSGGIDSSVMAHLFYRAGMNCSVAHCNFSLRGDESDADELFTRQLAGRFGFRFHLKKFDTIAFARDNKLSIQMAARKLRYSWFHELSKQEKYDFIVLGHHAGDVAETMLVNLVRGTGLAGVHGIRPVHGRLLRPLLFATRDQIQQYATSNNLLWREDSSNSDDGYIRNKIRHQIIPLLEEINPSFLNAMARHASIMSAYERLMDHFMVEVRKQVMHTTSGGDYSIDLKKLEQFPEPEILLYHLLHPFGFSAETCANAWNSRRSGAEFIADNFKLIRGRNSLDVIIHINQPNEFIIHENETIVELGHGCIEIEALREQDIKTQGSNLTDNSCAFLDGDKLSYPLMLRKWQRGDRFRPLGMHRHKLISDFITDEKLPPHEKEKVYLLLSGNEVAWVMGYRISDSFKLTEQTKNIRKFTWKKSENGGS